MLEVDMEAPADGPVMSTDEFARWLRCRIEERAPAAIIRFGDSEAKVLTCNREELDSTEGPIRMLERETGLSFASEDVLAIRERIMVAFEGADVLGLGFSAQAPNGHKASMRRLFALYANRVAGRRVPPLLAHCMLNHQIRDPLPEMLAGHPVSVISCRDLKPVCEGKWGLEDVAVYQVPSQYGVRDVDGPYEHAMRDIPIWPDVHARLHNELTVRERGEVFLVGAGLFGKDLCIRIRDEGGIALDLGAALDWFAGKLTRGPERRVLDLHARGLCTAEIATRLQRLFRVPIDGEWVEQTMDPLLNKIDAWRHQPLRQTYRQVVFETLVVPVAVDGATVDKVCCIALHTDRDGKLQPFAIWWSGATSAEPWVTALADLRARGMREMATALVSECDGLPEAVSAAFPAAELEHMANPNEALTKLRKALDAHGPFRDEESATKLIALVLNRT